MKHAGTQRIETKRLILRAFQLDDAKAMFRNWANDPEVTKYLTWPTHEREETTAQVVRYWVEHDAPEAYQWAITTRETGEAIGSISVVRMQEETGSMEIGYCIGRAWWGRGLMPEALEAVIQYLFQVVGVEVIRACHDPRNPNSGRVMRKCGMHLDGTMRHWGTNNQGVCDAVYYSLLRGEAVSQG